MKGNVNGIYFIIKILLQIFMLFDTEIPIPKTMKCSLVRPFGVKFIMLGKYYVFFPRLYINLVLVIIVQVF